MKKYDLLIKGGNLFFGDGEIGIRDIGIKNGKILDLMLHIEELAAEETIDAQGKLIVPGFVDTHMHVDKAYTANDDDSRHLAAAFQASYRSNSIPRTDEEIFDDIMKRSSRLAENCIRHGTTALKTNVLLIPEWKDIALEAMAALKKKYKDRIDIFTIVPFDDNPGLEETLLQASRDGKIDFIGGYPASRPNTYQIVNHMFELSEKLSLPIDAHCNESDVPDIDCFHYIVKQAFDRSMEGRVTLGHVTALSAKGLSEDAALAAIAMCAKAHINITTLTSCNMYLMNMNRRGPTRVEQLMNAGINVAIASDNVRDAYRPFGNCDLLEEALLTAQVHKLLTPRKLSRILSMVTYNAAQNTLLENYGLLPGCNADLVILDAPDSPLALLNQAEKLYVLKQGKVVARSGQLVAETQEALS